MSFKLRQKKLFSADSKSLWNCTLAPGWTVDESEILRQAIMKFGLGSWKAIHKTNCLPGKTPAQLNLQAQRMMGQQALGDFMGVRCDPALVWADNNLKQGPEYSRKNGCLINTGNNPSMEERKKAIASNVIKYGIKQEDSDKIKLDEIEIEMTDEQEREAERTEKKERLAYLLDAMSKMKRRLLQLESIVSSDSAELSKITSSSSSRNIEAKQEASEQESSSDIVGDKEQEPAESLDESPDESLKNRKSPKSTSKSNKSASKPAKRKVEVSKDEEDNMDEDNDVEEDDDFEKPKRKRATKSGTPGSGKRANVKKAKKA